MIIDNHCKITYHWGNYNTAMHLSRLTTNEKIEMEQDTKIQNHHLGLKGTYTLTCCDAANSGAELQ